MPWDPTRDLLTMQERLESLFGRANPGWAPPVDLTELDDRYVATVELPGLERADVQIEYAEQVLTIRGTRPMPRCPAERYQQLERPQGAFARSFRFTAPVVADEIAAELRDGILTIVVKKVTERRRIEVV
jgi:HSP20 family protein